MRFPMAITFSSVLVLFHLLLTTSALSLTTYQAINGFSAACTTAYNTELTDCSSSDFEGQGCSKKCIGFLDSLSVTLNTDCAGTDFSPNTLIGMFFNGTGVHFLCHNAGILSFSSGAAVENGQGGGQSASLGTPPAATEASAPTTSISTSSTTPVSSIVQIVTTSSTVQIATTSSTLPVIITSSTPQPAATSSTTTIVPITITPDSTTTSVAIVGVTVAPGSPSDAQTSTSSTKSSTSSIAGTSTSTSTGNGNGGGTPLDVETSSSACHEAALSVLWLVTLLLAGTGGVQIIWLS